MSFLRISLVLLIFTLFTLINNVHASGHDFPGVVELVGYNNRRARMSQDFNHGVSFVTPPMKKTRADIERVKQNIEEYNKLLKIDTKKLSDQQKDMLERIVERVARLKETLDTEEPTTTTSSNKKEINSIIETVTTLLPTTTESATSPTTTTDPVTTTKRDQSEARSNPNNSNNLSTKSNNSSSNHGKSKAKVRTNTSRRPSAPTKATTKRTTGIRPSVKPTTAAVTTASSTSSGSFSGQKIATITTIPPQVKPHQKQQQLDVVHDVLMKQQNHQEDDVAEQKTLPSISDHRPQNVQQRNPLGAVGGASDLMYDSNVTTSSIIDSLSNHAREDYYNRDSLSESNLKEKKPVGTAKPTKYHYYPHNQHIYLLPECAIQQVCNAVYVRLNYTQPLCACPSRYRDPCSASLNEDDLHTTKLIGDGKKKAITLAKTCEATTEMRECRSPKDWSLLALQNTRTGKSHYLVICRCPDHYKLEGPMAHDQPTYASVPGIRVFGMMCVKPGYSVRRPSVQPPKRYQLQKPYYVPSSNKYGTNKDRLPSYQQDSYQTQHQANYQYLSRPESSPIINSHTEFPESISLNSFSGIYGRTNEQKSDAITAEVEGSGDSGDSKREKRSVYELDENVPEFPWHRLQEFQQSILWD